MLALRQYIHLYFFLDTTYFGVVSGVFLVLDAGFVLKFCILVFPVFQIVLHPLHQLLIVVEYSIYQRFCW